MVFFSTFISFSPPIESFHWRERYFCKASIFLAVHKERGNPRDMGICCVDIVPTSASTDLNVLLQRRVLLRAVCVDDKFYSVLCQAYHKPVDFCT